MSLYKSFILETNISTKKTQWCQRCVEKASCRQMDVSTDWQKHTAITTRHLVGTPLFSYADELLSAGSGSLTM